MDDTETRKDALVRENRDLRQRVEELEANVFQLKASPGREDRFHSTCLEPAVKLDPFAQLLSGYRLSPHKVIRELLPYTNSRLEYELMMDHPTAYPVLAP